MIKCLNMFVFVCFSLTGCVTINIYFPAAATEKAADKIIDEVWQLQKTDQSSSGESKPDGSNSQKEMK